LAIITCITLQTILTLLSLLIPGFPSWIVIAASIALLGVAVICILTVDGGIRRADYLDQKVEAQTQFISTIKTGVRQQMRHKSGAKPCQALFFCQIFSKLL